MSTKGGTGALAAALAAAAVLAGCGGETASVEEAAGAELIHIDGSSDPFGGIEELVAASDLVVIATPGEVIGREDGRGGDPEVDPASGDTITGIPMAFLAVSTDEVLAGRAPAGDLVVGVLDPERVTPDSFGELALGAPVLLFLDCLTEAQTPGVTVVDEFCVPVGGDAGVADIDGDRYTARSLLVAGRDEAGPTASIEPVDFTEAEIRRAIADGAATPTTEVG